MATRLSKMEVNELRRTRTKEICFDCGQLILGGGRIDHEFWCDCSPTCKCEWTAYCRACITPTTALPKDQMGLVPQANRAERRGALRAIRKENKLAADLELIEVPDDENAG
jgi:hypothetical protein